MSFEKSLSIADDLQDIFNEDTRFIAKKLLTRLIFVSPIDTGKFRGGWFVDVGKSNREIDDSRRSATALAEGIAVIETARVVDYPELVISNNQPHGEKLNDGHSAQAPRKFVELEIASVVRLKGPVDV